MERKTLSLSLLCLMVHTASVLSVSLNNNLTVVLEDWNMQNVSLPLVDTIIFECSYDTSLNSTWNADVTNCSTDGQMLKCSHLSASDVAISCTKASSLNYTISVTIVDDLVVFVNTNFYYVRQGRTQLLELGEEAAPRDVEVTIPCIPVGSINGTAPRATWSFQRLIRDTETKNIEFPGVEVMFDNVTGDSEITLRNGILRMNRATAEMAGQYKCDFGSPFVLEKVLYWGPHFNEYDFQNSSATEGYHAPELWCEARVYPRNPIFWQRCRGNGENCYNECNEPENITHGGRFEFLTIPPFPFGSRLRIREAQLSDRGCYRCIVGSIAVPQTHYVFLRIRDNLAVLWPILGLLVEFLIVVLFILGGHVYQLWRKKQKPPARSASGGSDINSLLPNESLAQYMRSVSGVSGDSTAEIMRRRAQPEPSVSVPSKGFQGSDV